VTSGYEKFEDLLMELHRQVKPPRGRAAEANGQGAARHRSGTLPAADDEIIAKIRASAQAPKFEILFDVGDTSAYAGESEADFALLGILRFWTQDRDQVERLMRRSALYRRRWDEDHGSGETRLQYNIGRALDGNFETYEWPHDYLDYSAPIGTEFYGNKSEGEKRLPIKTVEEVIEEAGEEIPWCLEDLLARGAQPSASGPGGYGAVSGGVRSVGDFLRGLLRPASGGRGSGDEAARGVYPMGARGRGRTHETKGVRGRAR
jgi:NrS-1  polymerase HBD domain